MNRLPLILSEPPELSDEGAAECLDFLYEFTVAFENHYANQLRRYYALRAPAHPDLFDDMEADPMPF